MAMPGQTGSGLNFHTQTRMDFGFGNAGDLNRLIPTGFAFEDFDLTFRNAQEFRKELNEFCVGFAINGRRGDLNFKGPVMEPYEFILFSIWLNEKLQLHINEKRAEKSQSICREQHSSSCSGAAFVACTFRLDPTGSSELEQGLSSWLRIACEHVLAQ